MVDRAEVVSSLFISSFSLLCFVGEKQLLKLTPAVDVNSFGNLLFYLATCYLNSFEEIHGGGGGGGGYGGGGAGPHGGNGAGGKYENVSHCAAF